MKVAVFVPEIIYNIVAYIAYYFMWIGQVLAWPKISKTKIS